MSTYRKDYPAHWFVVDYEPTDTRLNLTAWKINSRHEDGTPFELEAPAHVSGYIKWDGCSELDFAKGLHFCGSALLEQHCGLLRALYEEAQAVFNDPAL